MQKNKSEYRILILAIFLIVVLFLVFSFSNTYNNKEVTKSPQEKQTIEGTLEVIHADDFENKKAYYYYYLRTDNGEKYSINNYKDQFVNFPSGSRIRLSAIINSNEKTIENPENIEFLQPPEQQNVIGEQRTLVVMAHFIDDNQQPWAVQFVRNLIFDDPVGSVNQYFKDVSDMRISLQGDVVGWYTLPIATTCQYYNILNSAITIVSQDPNVDLNSYDHIIVAVPVNGGCSWGGVAFGLRSYLGYRFYASLVRIMNQEFVGHEFGHNLGDMENGVFLVHANSLECGSAILFGDDCHEIAYGDPFDIMGTSGPFYMISYFRDLLGWTTQTQFLDVSEPGAYILSNLDTNAPGLKSLRILRGHDSYVNEPLWYYINYRNPVSFDLPLNEPPYFGVRSGIIVYASLSWQYFNRNLLLDMTPQSNVQNADFFDSALTIGNSYTDETAHITITPIEMVEDSMKLEISFGLIRDYSFEIDTGVDFYPNWNQEDSTANNNKPDGFVTTSSGILDNVIKYQGSQSLKIQVTNNRGYSYQDIPVEYNKRYRVGGYVKTDCSDNNCHGTILSECEKQDHTPIWDYNNCKLNINPINIRRLYGDNNWTYIEFYVENNRQDAKFLRVLCYNTPGPNPVGSGVIWCDSFNVIELPRGGGIGSPLFLKNIVQRIGD